MTHNHYSNDFSDTYDRYAETFDPMRHDRQARRKRRPKAHHQPKKTDRDIIDDIADADGIEAGFEISYQPSLFEAEWLLTSLRTFYDQAIITDVLALVKGGKEASVYACETHPSTGQQYIAVKVYRPRKFRQLRNDAMYREGREIIGIDGKPITDRDKRAMRAINRGTSFGEMLSHTSWLMHEVNTLQQLHADGGAVPEVFASADNAIAMSYLGELHNPAPTLHEAAPESDELPELFAEAMRNIELMLSKGLIHGDLSAYNILYWEGRLTVIDFPQVADIHNNSNAYAILKRDVTRVCEYFARRGLDCDAADIHENLWQKYGPEAPLPVEDEFDEEF